MVTKNAVFMRSVAFRKRLLSVDMYRVCHIHLCKIYHAGIELSNVILSLAGMLDHLDILPTKTYM